MSIDADYLTLRDLLQRNHIPYEQHTHDEVHTMEDCYAFQQLPERAVMPKNILLCNRQQTQFYLYLSPPFEPFRTARFSKALGVSRLSFAQEEQMHQFLHVSSGALTPLSLIFDSDCRVRPVINKKLLGADRLAFHPLIPTQTFIFSTEDFIQRFIPLTGHELQEVTVEADE